MTLERQFLSPALSARSQPHDWTHREDNDDNRDGKDDNSTANTGCVLRATLWAS